jgi:AcrR family transcriptional regulator
LVAAAMELFRKEGYDQTTVAEIAAKAGLTERTFFRYFADKRAVLFSGAEALEKLLVDMVAGAPDTASPMDAVGLALEATGPMFEERRDFARKRQALILAHAELMERELIKLSSLVTAIAGALRRRGVPESAAGLCAEAGIGVFRVAFQRWVSDAQSHSLTHHIRASLDLLSKLTTKSRRSKTVRGRSTRSVLV